MAGQLAGGRGRKTVYGKTRREVAGKLDELRQLASKRGGLPDPGRRQVNHLLDLWLEQVAERLRPTTVANYRCVANRHIRPRLGDLLLSKLGPESVAHLYRDVAAEGRRLPVVVHVIMRGACKLGVAWRWLGHDPTEPVSPPTYKTPQKGVWTRQQVDLFLRESRGHWLSPLWRFLLWSDLRVGAATALRWQSVDWQAGTVGVGGTLVRSGGAWSIGEPKTASALRTVAVPTDGMDALREQRRRQNEWRLAAGPRWQPVLADLAFSNESGEPLHRATIVHALERECRRLELPVLTTHGLRRMHISLALEAGVGVAAVARRVGHSNPSVTWTSYARAVATDEEVAERIGEALAQASR